MKRLTILMTAVLLAGCSAQAGQDNGPILPQAELIGTADHNRLYRFFDLELESVCYITVGSEQSSTRAPALNCLPLARVH